MSEVYSSVHVHGRGFIVSMISDLMILAPSLLMKQVCLYCCLFAMVSCGGGGGGDGGTFYFFLQTDFR